jgi:predicted ATPase/DNA-binding SARP family transcriptional activator
LFGDFSLTFGNKLVRIGAPKTAALLCYLVLHAGEAVPRTRLASALWPDIVDSDARANLRRHLSLLQHALPEPAQGSLRVDKESVFWADGPGVWVDVHAFDVSCLAGDDAAIELYRGELLPAFEEEWLAPIRERYREACIAALLTLLSRFERAGDTVRFVATGRRVLAIDAMREDVVRRLMTAHASTGDRAAALAEYADFVRRLRDEFGVEPMGETTALADAVRTGTPLPNARPALTSTPAESGTSFVGRARELAELRVLLRRTRSLTLVGVGGIGKSRLARALAADVYEEFADGTRFVELAGLPDDADPMDPVLRAFDLAEIGPGATPRILMEHLRTRAVLLVLDNCERHARRCRALIEHLRDCPGVRVVATSRVRLGAAEESTFAVAPLSIPTHGRRDSEAVALFVARARAAGGPPIEDDGPEAVAAGAICRRLDGIPLAIELAAARCRVLRPRQVLERLSDPALVLDFEARDLPPHQATVRAAISWSFDAVGPAERSALQALSVFREPFTFEAAEAAAAAKPGFVDALTSLVEHSLLAVAHDTHDTRYRMLEPVREFAFAELVASGNEGYVYEREIGYFDAMTSTLGLPSGGNEPRRAFDTLERDRLNIRAAFEGATAHATTGSRAPALAERMATFWQERGHVGDGDAVYTGLLALDLPTRERQRLLVEASRFARLAADYDRAREDALEALGIAESLDDAARTMDALYALALLDFTVGDHDASARRLEAILAIARPNQDLGMAGKALGNLGLIAVHRNDHEAAFTYLTEAVQLLSESGERQALAATTSALAYCERTSGHLEEARAFSEQALGVARLTGNASVASSSLITLAHVAVLGDEPDNAIPYLRETLMLGRDGGFAFTLVHAMEVLARLFVRHERFADASLFLHGARSLAQRLSLTRNAQDDASLVELADATDRRLLPADAVKARLVLRDASLQRCADEALARLAILGETRHVAS